MPREAFAHSINDQIRLGNSGGPAPNAYFPQLGERLAQPHVGKAGLAPGNVESYLDIPVKRALDVPGPGSYEIGTGEFALPEGGFWSDPAQPVFKLEGSGGPEPGTYDPKMVPRTVPLAKFTSKSPKVAEYIASAERHGKQVPGPGAYNDVDAYDATNPFLPEGGRTLDAKPNNSYFDEVAKARAHQIGPKYNISRGFIVEPQGQPVYRYASSTIESTQHLVKQVLGTETPGPGTYELPDVKPPPGAIGFHGLGRDHAQALPPPFDYNCPKDYTRRYYVPVLQSGAGDAIYGRFNHTGEMAKKPSPTQEQEERLERSRSTGALRDERLAREASQKHYRRELHNGVKQAATTYKDLSGKKHKGTERLLPMAARRYVDVGTEIGDPEAIAYEEHRAKLHQAAEFLQGSIESILEPLNTKTMVERAEQVLNRKVAARMKREGVPVEKRKLVTKELSSALDSSFNEAPMRDPLPQPSPKRKPAPRSLDSSEEEFPVPQPGRSPSNSPVKESPQGKKAIISPTKESPPAKKQTPKKDSPKEQTPTKESPPQRPGHVADTFELSGDVTASPEPQSSPAPEASASFVTLEGGSPSTFVQEAGASPGPGSSPGPESPGGDGAGMSSIELGATAIARPQDLTFGESGGGLSFDDMKGNTFDQWQEKEKSSPSAKLKKRTLTQEEKGMIEAFNLTDLNQDGKISKAEMKKAMESAGGTPTDEDVNELFLIGDIDDNGFIDIEEFYTLMLSGIEKRFSEFDIDKEGYISVADLRKVLRVLGTDANWAEEDLDKMIHDIEKNTHGKVDFRAFRRSMLYTEGSDPAMESGFKTPGPPGKTEQFEDSPEAEAPSPEAQTDQKE